MVEEVVTYLKSVNEGNKTDVIKYVLFYLIQEMWRSLWPPGLRRGSAASRLLGLRVRIPPGTWPSLIHKTSSNYSSV